MQLKRLMENWKKTINEEKWDPTEIVGALAEDFGYTLETAPKWMNALVSKQPYLMLFNALDEDKHVWDEHVYDLISIYDSNDRKKKSALDQKTANFIKLAEEELGVTLKPKTLILGITQLLIDEQPETFSDYYDESIKTFIVPIQYNEMFTKKLSEFDDYIAADIVDFANTFLVQGSHRLNTLERDLNYVDHDEQMAIYDLMRRHTQDLEDIYQDIYERIDHYVWKNSL